MRTAGVKEDVCEKIPLNLCSFSLAQQCNGSGCIVECSGSNPCPGRLMRLGVLGMEQHVWLHHL